MIEILTIPMHDKGVDRAVTAVLSSCVTEKGGENSCISATGAHGLVHSKMNPQFATALRSFYMNLPDGVPAVWVGRLKGARKIQRCYGPKFFEEVMRLSAPTPIKHFLCGGKEGVAEELKKVCEDKFDNRNCVGTFCPPFREMREDELRSLGSRISESGADIVWIGLSTPKQEMFAKRLSGYTRVKFIVTVGAAFDFHTGRVREAPSWMQRSGLEWFFRLCMEPKRLWRRYGVVVPLFIYYNFIELISGNFFR